MELKPKSVKLVDFKEELLPSGRKLLHYIFEDKYGSRYSWTAPWRDKEGERGVERLFFKALEIEEWNDYEGVWSEELRKTAKEMPSLEEMELPVKIQIGGITEDVEQDELLGTSQKGWRIRVDILADKQSVTRYKEDDKDYITIGEVSMAWDLLRSELSTVEGVKSLAKRIGPLVSRGPFFGDIFESFFGGEKAKNTQKEEKEVGIYFWVWVEKAADRTEYQIISRNIVSSIRHFIRSRLSEYKVIKKGFEEQG